MPVFIADSDLPGITPQQLQSARQRAIKASSRLTAAGAPMRYLRAVWVPGDWRVMWLFETEEAATVEAVMRTAEIPFLRVVEATDLGTSE